MKSSCLLQRQQRIGAPSSKPTPAAFTGWGRALLAQNVSLGTFAAATYRNPSQPGRFTFTIGRFGHSS